MGGKPPGLNLFWLWWPTIGMVVLAANFIWFVIPLGLGFRAWPDGFRGQIADGIFRFSYFILNPSLFVAWVSLPWFHGRGLTGAGWRLFGFVTCLFGGCIGAVLALT